MPQPAVLYLSVLVEEILLLRCQIYSGRLPVPQGQLVMEEELEARGLMELLDLLTLMQGVAAELVRGIVAPTKETRMSTEPGAAVGALAVGFLARLPPLLPSRAAPLQNTLIQAGVAVEVLVMEQEVAVQARHVRMLRGVHLAPPVPEPKAASSL